MRLVDRLIHTAVWNSDMSVLKGKPQRGTVTPGAVSKKGLNRERERGGGVAWRERGRERKVGGRGSEREVGGEREGRREGGKREGEGVRG